MSTSMNAACVAPRRSTAPRKQGAARRALLLLAGIGATATSACDAPSDPMAPEPAIASVSLTPGAATLVSIGATLQLQATARDLDGIVLDGITMTWASADPGVAEVDGTGVVTARANGTARISASSGEFEGLATITVSQEVSSVTLAPNVFEMVSLGETVVLVVEARDANGVTIAGADATWSSADAAIASVDRDGQVTGVADGTATITASVAGVAGHADITVDPVPASLGFVTPPGDARAGDRFDAAVTVGIFDALGSIVADAERPVTLLLGSNPSLGSLLGPTQVTATAGTAVLPDLYLDRAGAGYTLLATAPGLAPAESPAFAIDPCAAGTPSLPRVLCIIDPEGDGPIDITRLVMYFDAQGNYEIHLTAHPIRPFVGAFRVNVNIYNPGAFAFFNDVLNDFDLATPQTLQVLRGRSAALTLWNEGAEVYSHSLDGAPNPAGVSLFRSAVARLVGGQSVGEDMIAFARRPLPGVVR